MLVYGGAIVALACIVERSTHYNVFNHLSSFVPGLHFNGDPTLGTDSRGYRVLGSSQHPIAMGVALVMLVPLAAYRAFVSRRTIAWLAAVAMLLGALATISRTAIIAFAAVVITMFILRPARMKRMWPLVVPLLLVVHLAMPGTLGTIKSAFLPSSGLIAQQQDAAVGSGRLATLGPALRKEFLPDPLVGEGYGTRVTTPDETVPIPNGPILDDGWLGMLLETGVAGALAFLWVFVRFLRRVGGAAKHDDSSRGWFLAAVCASVAAYGVSMFFFDATSFIQVTFIFFILLGLGSAGYRLGDYEEASVPAAGRRRSRTASPILAGS
jgi:polysaccharide biosynthesis protein PslJ